MDVFPMQDALLIPKTEDGRVLFAVPWGGRLLVGTTDEEVSPEDELLVTKEDVEYLLMHLNQYLARPVGPEKVVSGFAGARPLVGSADEGDTKSLARDDVIEVDPTSGLISIMGGKWTTHRAMAEDTINRVQQILGVSQTDCLTRNHLLFGGEGYTDDYWEKLYRRFGVSEGTARHLSSKFGTAAEKVAALRDENSALVEPILAGYPAIKAEIVYSARQEMASTIEDILARRIGLELFSWRDAIDAAPVVGLLLANELGWSTSQRRVAVDEYIEKINHYLITAGLEPQKSSELSLAKR
jgi:glycerol-3-phosphate dehydrogenase